MPYFSMMKAAWVPFPAPGGPSSMSFMVIFLLLVRDRDECSP
jgi:hypothetical protein